MIHPSGLQTTDYEPSEAFEPNGWQIESAARRALGDMPPPPHRRLRLRYRILITVGSALLVYATTNALLRMLG